MYKFFIRVIAFVGIVLMAADVGSAAWVISENQGMSIRHPKDWKVDWREMSVNVGHSENRMVWCLIPVHCTGQLPPIFLRQQGD